MIKSEKHTVIVLLIILSVSGALAHSYFYENLSPDLRIYNKLLSTHIDFNFPKEIYKVHNHLINGTFPTSPNRYRVLAPFICESIATVLDYSSSYFNKYRAFFAAFALYCFLAIFFLLAGLYYWLRIWFSREQSLIGVLFVAGTMSVPFREHTYSPWSILEVGLFTASLIAIYRKRYWLIALLTALATINRETGIFIPMVFFLANIDDLRKTSPWNWLKSKPLLLSLGYVLLWASIFLGLRFMLGWVPHVGSILIELNANLTALGLLTTLKNTSLFLGAFWIFAFIGFKHAPVFVRRASLVIPFYLLPIYIWAPWWEVRLLMTMYPLLIALGLSFVFKSQVKNGNA